MITTTAEQKYAIIHTVTGEELAFGHWLIATNRGHSHADILVTGPKECPVVTGSGEPKVTFTGQWASVAIAMSLASGSNSALFVFGTTTREWTHARLAAR